MGGHGLLAGGGPRLHPSSAPFLSPHGCHCTTPAVRGEKVKSFELSASLPGRHVRITAGNSKIFMPGRHSRPLPSAFSLSLSLFF